MAGVSDTPGFVADLGPPKWQVYQIHLALKPILDPQNGRCSRYTWLCRRSWTPKMAGVSDTPGFVADLGPPKWQVYQIHLALKPILDPQNGRCIRYTWLCSRSWTPKMAGVSDTPGFVADLGPPKWQVYQIHLALKPILDPQNGRCIRYTWLCSRSLPTSLC